MRSTAVVAIMVILVMASFGTGYLVGIRAPGTATLSSTSSSTSTSKPSATTTTVSTLTQTPPLPPILAYAAEGATGSNESIGVDLVLSLNASTLDVGQDLGVGVSLFNTLPSLNSVPTTKDWPFAGIPVALWSVCYGPIPAYAVLFKGNYSLEEVESMANATITTECAEGGSVDHVVFLANSSQAILTGSGFGPTPGPYQLSLNFTARGYWNLLNNSKQLNAPIIDGQNNQDHPVVETPFTPGVYTIAVSDMWGESALLHFTVVS